MFYEWLNSGWHFNSSWVSRFFPDVIQIEIIIYVRKPRLMPNTTIWIFIMQCIYNIHIFD